MRKPRLDTFVSLTRRRSIQILAAILIFYLLFMSYEIPFVFKSGFAAVPTNELITMSSKEEVVQQQEAPERFSLVQVQPPLQSRRNNTVVSGLVFLESLFDSGSGNTRNGNISKLQKSAKSAWLVGKKYWQELESGKVRIRVTVPKKNGSESCLHSISINGSEFRQNGNVMVLPCGLTLGSHITVVGIPRPPHAFSSTLTDILGSGIFNADGDNWKFQRQISSHEFNTKSLRKFVETVVETELSDRLIPVLSSAAAENSVLDLQDVLQRFAFDNICKIAFGFDPAYLAPSLPQSDFAIAFEEALKLSSERFGYLSPAIWKLKKLLNIGSEKRLKDTILQVRDFSRNIVREKKQELKEKSAVEASDLLSRILISGHSDDEFVVDMVISFIVAGRDTTSAALTWFFWLISSHPHVEKGILEEINEKTKESVYDEVKDMVYTHASLCESMRLYPPVPSDTKEAAADDVLPDGTVVKKGMRVTYHPYAMGRMESLWGQDWAEFKPERWLKRDVAEGKWSFVGVDPYTYTVFQAGPRICLGKEMAFLQMKRVVAGVLHHFRVLPATEEEGFQPVFLSYLTSKMKDGFPVKIENRESAM